jgi:hypothetical protein
VVRPALEEQVEQPPAADHPDRPARADELRAAGATVELDDVLDGL